jgi:alkanesulfonate monooxygenase SsuD/methylene tetrahydromethanopterin reductase-like flavin-dependent oxidoreductase (luciferase family)
MSAPRHGLFVPPFDVLADPNLLAELAADAERAGWDGIFLWDHLIYARPVQAILDPWICLAAIAVATESMTLGAMVTPLSRRRPAVVARQAVTLDLLSRGRLVLGFGLGDDGSSGEMSRFGEEPDPHIRAGMLDEGLFVLRRMLSGELVDHQGQHYTAAGVQLLPRPYRESGIPFWIGARWPNARPLRRAAKYEGAFVISLKSADELRDLIGALDQLRGDGGEFDVVVELPSDDQAVAWSVPGVTWLLTRFGPYDMDAAAVASRIAAGPPK